MGYPNKEVGLSPGPGQTIAWTPTKSIGAGSHLTSSERLEWDASWG